MLSGGKTVDLRLNLRTLGERALKMLSNALFRGAAALLVPELCANLYIKTVENGKILPMTFGDRTFVMTFDLTLKNDRTSFVKIFDALSNVAVTSSRYMAQEPSKRGIRHTHP